MDRQQALARLAGDPRVRLSEVELERLLRHQAEGRLRAPSGRLLLQLADVASFRDLLRGTGLTATDATEAAWLSPGGDPLHLDTDTVVGAVASGWLPTETLIAALDLGCVTQVELDTPLHPTGGNVDP